MSDLETFRKETRAWLEEHCPSSMRNRSFHWEDAHEVFGTDEAQQWHKAMADRGWTAPTWPAEYGGGGLDAAQARVIQEEMQRIKAVSPYGGMGITMIGPTLLEFGTEDQKKRHIPKIVSGEVQWCQGYSEPGAGSDLAAIKTRAVLDGDNFVINGQKVWTSGAQYADWMFALVRTDPSAPKHEGISFVLLDMHQPGVTIKPISLISGSSPFCETFFDDAIARREDLVGEPNQGWAIGKRLLQYERSGIGGLSGGGRQSRKPGTRRVNEFAELARQYAGETDGKVAGGYREDILDHSMTERAFQLTAQRAGEENRSGTTPGEATSIFKLVGSDPGTGWCGTEGKGSWNPRNRLGR
ncbi:MAG: acyl-CoA dehydrogenase family protein [Gammaproteobacteria bacterium]|nr:acyl-CoA dehydrogenase family protein [Gammaproteobacteria bacterium]